MNYGNDAEDTGHKLTTFQVSNDWKEFQFDMALAFRLSDHQFTPLHDDTISSSRWKRPLVFQLPVSSGFNCSLRRYTARNTQTVKREFPSSHFEMASLVPGKLMMQDGKGKGWRCRCSRATPETTENSNIFLRKTNSSGKSLVQILSKIKR